MSNRPLSITLIGWLFIAVGCTGIVRRAWPLIDAARSGRLSSFTRHDMTDLFYVEIIGLIAFAGGLFTLRGSNIGRWLIAVWMILHILISFMHTWIELLVHCLIFAAMAYFLFLRKSAYFFKRES